MITLTRLSGQRFALNPDLMERIEATPDTIISLVDGTKHVVTEGVEEVVKRVRHYRASVVALAQQIEMIPEVIPAAAAASPLRLVAPAGGE